MSGGTRIDFVSVDAARFNALRDQWRGAAASCTLPKIGHRLASVLPNYVNREYGYAFPTDDDLAETVSTSTRNVGKGMAALDAAELIDRSTTTRRDDKREAIGKQRRIYLTLPTLKPNHVAPRDRSFIGERNTPAYVNGTEVNGTPDVNGTKWVGERNDGVPNIPDRTTPDLKNSPGERKLGDHTHARDLTLHLPPDPDPSPAHSRIEEVVRSPRPNPIPTPPSWGDDEAFLASFDAVVLEVLEMVDATQVGAGSVEDIARFAFDQTTKSNTDFMPVFWADLLACRTSQTTEWFKHRTAGLTQISEAA